MLIGIGFGLVCSDRIGYHDQTNVLVTQLDKDVSAVLRQVRDEHDRMLADSASHQDSMGQYFGVINEKLDRILEHSSMDDPALAPFWEQKPPRR
jgi:hypothetical protein